MAATFSRTLRSLEADRRRWPGLEIVLLGVVGAGLAWAVLGRVTVYEATDKARLEVLLAAHAVAAPVGGRVVESHLTVGRAVEAGMVLMVLDAEAERRALRQSQARCRALVARQGVLAEEMASEQAAAEDHKKARTNAAAAAAAQIVGAKSRAQFAERQAVVFTELRRTKALPELDFAKSQADHEAAKAEVRTLEFALARLEHDRLTEESDRRTRLAKLRREAAELAVEEAAGARLENEIELRVLRAPVTGRIGEAAGEYRAGSVVRAADKVAAIIPPGAPHVVAYFPAAAVGRIRPAQPARVRLHGFAWTQYGTLGATVEDIGNEAKEGLIRVELALDPAQTSLIPREHGLPGAVEVEIEQVAPALLVLRAAGHLLAAGGARTP